MTQGTELSVEVNADAFAAQEKGNYSSSWTASENNNTLYNNKYT